MNSRNSKGLPPPNQPQFPSPGVFLLSSESVTEGHPDKVCDWIADSILDAFLEQDPDAKVACEVLCKGGDVVLAGEITSPATVDLELVTRDAIAGIGYTDPCQKFCAEKVRVTSILQHQRTGEYPRGTGDGDIFAATDQGIVHGYATRETPEMLPLPLVLAHRITATLAAERKSGRLPWLRPDAKAQATVLYEEGRPRRLETVVVSTQHAPDIDLKELREVLSRVLPEVCGDWWPPGRFLINPAGAFVLGGPEGDCGVTGRKIIADTYGGAARHGGGAFSGKDAGKTDRSAAYFARMVARQIVLRGIADRAEVGLAYAIGVQEPVGIAVDTHGTGCRATALDYARRFDFRPAAMVERLGLRRPIFRSTTNYGHFGKPELPWEK